MGAMPMQSLSPSMSPSLRVSTGSGPDFAYKDSIKLACVIREYGGGARQGQGARYGEDAYGRGRA